MGYVAQIGEELVALLDWGSFGSGQQVIHSWRLW
jgi:hypothetical protein